ncbi:MAG: hypothetical protein ABW110_04605 [Steroidobacteraceae bacterium]
MNTRTPFAPRVAIYGLGFIGKSITQLVHEKGWPIVAAYNRAGEKVGQDLGRLAGLGKDLGIVVQDYEKADYSGLKADVALIAGPDYLNDCFPIYERFLTAGINVLSFGSHAYQPYWFFPEIAKKIDSLAREHDVTFTGSGLWDMTRIWSGLIAGGPCIKISSIEYLTNIEAVRQGVHWLPKLGVGLTVEEFDTKIGCAVGRFNEVLQVPSVIVLQHYGYTVTHVKLRQEPVVFAESVYCKEVDQEVAAGRCVGTRVIIDVDTKEGVSAHNQFEYRLFRSGEVEAGTWKINGSPGMQVTVAREDSHISSATSLLNRVPDVLRAKPGIVTIMEMGPELPSVFL